MAVNVDSILRKWEKQLNVYASSKNDIHFEVYNGEESETLVYELKKAEGENVELKSCLKNKEEQLEILKHRVSELNTMKEGQKASKTKDLKIENNILNDELAKARITISNLKNELEIQKNAYVDSKVKFEQYRSEYEKKLNEKEAALAAIIKKYDCEINENKIILERLALLTKVIKTIDDNKETFYSRIKENLSNIFDWLWKPVIKIRIGGSN